MYINITHIFLCAFLPECTLSQLFLYVRWQFIITNKYKKKPQMRIARGQSLTGTQGAKPKASSGICRSWHCYNISALLCGAAYLCHTWLCVPVLAGLFCNVNHTVAGTNTTYVPDFVSMPCSINRENGETHLAFYKNRKKPKYVGCEILLVSWHHYLSCTAGVDEEKHPWTAEHGPDSSWGGSAGCPRRDAARHELPTHHPAQPLATGPAQSKGRTEDSRAKEAHTLETQLRSKQWSPGQDMARSPPSPALRPTGHLLRVSLMGRLV